MKKRLMATAMLVAMVTSLVSNSLAANAYAKGVVEETNGVKEELAKGLGTSCTNMFNDDKYEFISRKVAEEKESYTGILPEELEDKLNENGVLDEEIECLTADELKFIYSTDVADLEIISSIYMYEDIEDSNVDRIELSADQVNKLYAEKYYNQGECDCFEKEELPETNDEGIEEVALSVETVSRDITKSSMMVADITEEGITTSSAINVSKAANVQDNCFYENGSQEKANTTKCSSCSHAYLKQTAYAKKNGDVINLTIIAQWIVSPKSRYVDYLRVNFEGMKYNDGTCYVRHKYTRTIQKIIYRTTVTYNQSYAYYYSGSSSVGTYMNTLSQKEGLYSAAVNGDDVDITNDTYDVEPGGIVVFMKFHQDTYSTAWQNDHQFTTTSYLYSNEGIVINVTLKDDADKSLTEEFYSTYYHFYTKEEYDVKAIKEVTINLAASAVTCDKIGIILSTGKLISTSGASVKEYCTSTYAFNPTLQNIYSYGYRYK